MKKIFFIGMFILSKLVSDTTYCTDKQFLLNILKSDETWYIDNNISKKYYPFTLIKTEGGMIKIKNGNSDFHPIIININVDSVGEVGIYMYGGLPTTKNIQMYDNKDFIFKPYKNDCLLDKIKIKIKTINTYKKNEEVIIFKKLKKGQF